MQDVRFSLVCNGLISRNDPNSNVVYYEQPKVGCGVGIGPLVSVQGLRFRTVGL